MGWPRKVPGPLHDFSLKPSEGSATPSLFFENAVWPREGWDLKSLILQRLTFVHLIWKHRGHLFLILVVPVLPYNIILERRKQIPSIICRLWSSATREISCLIILSDFKQ